MNPSISSFNNYVLQHYRFLYSNLLVTVQCILFTWFWVTTKYAAAPNHSIVVQCVALRTNAESVIQLSMQNNYNLQTFWGLFFVLTFDSIQKVFQYALYMGCAFIFGLFFLILCTNTFTTQSRDDYLFMSTLCILNGESRHGRIRALLVFFDVDAPTTVYVLTLFGNKKCTLSGNFHLLVYWIGFWFFFSQACFLFSDSSCAANDLQCCF